jgi:hypothetical protein
MEDTVEERLVHILSAAIEMLGEHKFKQVCKRARSHEGPVHVWICDKCAKVVKKKLKSAHLKNNCPKSDKQTSSLQDTTLLIPIQLEHEIPDWVSDWIQQKGGKNTLSCVKSFIKTFQESGVVFKEAFPQRCQFVTFFENPSKLKDLLGQFRVTDLDKGKRSPDTLRKHLDCLKDFFHDLFGRAEWTRIDEEFKSARSLLKSKSKFLPISKTDYMAKLQWIDIQSLAQSVMVMEGTLLILALKNNVKKNSKFSQAYVLLFPIYFYIRIGPKRLGNVLNLTLKETQRLHSMEQGSFLLRGLCVEKFKTQQKYNTDWMVLDEIVFVLWRIYKSIRKDEKRDTFFSALTSFDPISSLCCHSFRDLLQT